MDQYNSENSFYVTLLSHHQLETFSLNNSTEFLNSINPHFHLNPECHEIGLAQISFSFPAVSDQASEIISNNLEPIEKLTLFGATGTDAVRILKKTSSLIRIDNFGVNVLDFFRNVKLKLKASNLPVDLYQTNDVGSRTLKVKLESELRCYVRKRTNTGTDKRTVRNTRV
jgi:hypothetical protein